MNKEKNSNSGFTLIELIIAMAILAFLMTAVASFMSAGVFSYKKAKADVSVHNNAQTVYNEIIDSVMQANDIVIKAYVSQGNKTVDFSIPGADIDTGVKLTDDYYYIVKDDAAWKAFQKTAEYKADPSLNVMLYAKPEDPDPNNPDNKYPYLKDGAELYVLSIITERGVDLDIGACKEKTTGEYYDAFAIETGATETTKVIKQLEKTIGGTKVGCVDQYNNKVYDTIDTLRSIYSFDGKSMYYQKKYRYMVKNNDYFNWDETILEGAAPITDDSLYNYLFSDSFSYVKLSATKNLSGVIAKVDADAATISFEFKFNDKNMTYDSKGIAQIRNSYVLKPKSSRLLITVGTDTDAQEE